jgi:hypothetical protein
MPHEIDAAQHLSTQWWVLILYMLFMVLVLVAAPFASRLYDEARRDPRNEGRYTIVQRRVTRRFFELLRAGDTGAYVYLAAAIAWLLIIVALGVLF